MWFVLGLFNPTIHYAEQASYNDLSPICPQPISQSSVIISFPVLAVLEVTGKASRLSRRNLFSFLVAHTFCYSS